MSLETKLEKDFINWCKKNGIVTLKLNANWYKNIPDRIVVLPHTGVALFIEFKRLGEKPRIGQMRRLRQLRRMGYNAYVADTLEDAIALVQSHAETP